MILRPISPTPPQGGSCIPAFHAIEPTQHMQAVDYWMVMQNDHAQIAGDIAAAIGAEFLPPVPTDAVEAIELHDSGWVTVDEAMTQRALRTPPPVSFLDAQVSEFVQAWTGSIDKAEKKSPTGGLIVSAHFCRLVDWRRQAIDDSPATRAQLDSFTRHEAARRDRLAPAQSHSSDQIARLTDVLQFCDLVSLYLCCGARQPVEFPQRFGDRTIRLRRTGGDQDTSEFCFDPSPLHQPIFLTVDATRCPSRPGAESAAQLNFALR